METIKHKVEFCVVGGGIAGMCAAIAAARHGVKTILMHERPVLGGNASSEIRMWICGAYKYLETGLIEEIRLEDFYRNNCPNYSVWDSILYEKVKFQENLTCLLNCSCMDATMENGRIRSVKGWQLTTQCFHEVEADFFADCSGDSILAPLTGAEFRIGREAKSEFGETLAQDVADRRTMGMSCLMQARETDSPKKFVPPAWAYKYPSDDAFPTRGHILEGFQNFWWIELGGEQDSIRDTEDIRDELLKVTFGLWDHIKNHGDHGADNWVLDWVGFLPGKRESRRYVGDHILSEKEVLSGGKFDDIVAYGGWPIDDHHPGGFNHYGPPNINILPDQPYGIPLRSLYSKNVPNLLFAGRNISASHTALSSTRVMATCATLGQAVGTAVFHALQHDLTPREVCAKHIREIQNTLMDDDCYLPGLKRPVAPLSATAKLTASDGNPEPLRNGVDRPIGGDSNAWTCARGSHVDYIFGQETQLSEARIIFDSDLDRVHYNMISYYPKMLPEWMPKFETPASLVKEFHLEADGVEIFRETNNYQRLVKIPLACKASTLRLVIDEVRIGNGTKIFAFEVK